MTFAGCSGEKRGRFSEVLVEKVMIYKELILRREDWRKCGAVVVSLGDF